SGFPCHLLEIVIEIQPCHTKRRPKAEYGGGDQAEGEGREYDRRVEEGVPTQREEAGAGRTLGPLDEDVVTPKTEYESQRAARQREKESFRKESTDDAPAGSPAGPPDS